MKTFAGTELIVRRFSTKVSIPRQVHCIKMRGKNEGAVSSEAIIQKEKMRDHDREAWYPKACYFRERKQNLGATQPVDVVKKGSAGGWRKIAGNEY